MENSLKIDSTKDEILINSLNNEKTNMPINQSPNT